jgi:hypothetical protein
MGVYGLPEKCFRDERVAVVVFLEVQIVLADHVVYAARSDS